MASSTSATQSHHSRSQRDGSGFESDQEEGESLGPKYSYIGEQGLSGDDDDDEEEADDIIHTNRGADGRFVSTQETSHSPTLIQDSWLVSTPMAGGPEDGSVIPSYGGHVAASIWGGVERGVLRCMSRRKMCTALDQLRQSLLPETLAPIDQSGLSHLPGIMYQHLDWPLISAFVERWQPDTNNFHLPFGEMTIMLHDVYHILGISVDGTMVSTVMDPLQLRQYCSFMMDLPVKELRKPTYAPSGALSSKVLETSFNVERPLEIYVVSFLWILLGSSLFVDKSGNKLHPSIIHELQPVEGTFITSSYSWGSATLAYLYRQLGQSSRGDCDFISGCLTLLQAWIYEYFPCFLPQQGTLTREPGRPRALLWDVGSPPKSPDRLYAFRARLDVLTDIEVNWMPYGPDPASVVPTTLFSGFLRYRKIIEPYMPDRVVKQLGLVQVGWTLR
ncbi:protein MAINTENANCE OF MERISTEMS-like [Chenopodium quinoa]|uniref:protein MAINTENANCE OF MERISTEMS-like n=1 Tax=Chenopodium quinoa TaxID=63459 RepID=UPI000B789AA3|nr:protein MAINTENANCE OF MERISTEMS-like [Chenopodium quinoa]